jgi:hypothetical protein
VLITCCWGVVVTGKVKAPDQHLFDQWSSSVVKVPDNDDLTQGEDGVEYLAKTKALLQELWDFLVSRSGIGHAVVVPDNAKKASGQPKSPRPHIKNKPQGESDGEVGADVKESDAQVEAQVDSNVEEVEDANVEEVEEVVQVDTDANVEEVEEVVQVDAVAQKDAEGSDATHCLRLRDVMRVLDQELSCDFDLDGEGGEDDGDLAQEDDVEPESREDICRKARTGVKTKRKSLSLLALYCCPCPLSSTCDDHTFPNLSCVLF